MGAYYRPISNGKLRRIPLSANFNRPISSHLTAKSSICTLTLLPKTSCMPINVAQLLSKTALTKGSSFENFPVCLWGLLENPWFGMLAESSSDHFRLPALRPVVAGAYLKALDSISFPKFRHNRLYFDFDFVLSSF